MIGLKQISGNTQIVFTIKTFFAFIGAILGLFYGFYQIVVVPKVNSSETHYQIMFEAQKDQNTQTNQELIKVNNSIGTLYGIVETLSKDKISVKQSPNTSGSFGDNTISDIGNNNTKYRIN